ncbi:MAG: hypothetical protein ACI9H6_000470 [Patiriisocius sp.]|jgi:hypothetical protein
MIFCILIFLCLQYWLYTLQCRAFANPTKFQLLELVPLTLLLYNTAVAVASLWNNSDSSLMYVYGGFLMFFGVIGTSLIFVCTQLRKK